MSRFAGRPRYLIATVLFGAAIASEFVSKSHIGRALVTPIVSTANPPERSRWEQVRSRHLGQADIACRVGLGFAFLALAAWLASRIHREGGRQDVPSLLLMGYVLLLLMMV